MQLGIDFGTTRTVVTVVDRGNTPVVGFQTPDGDVVDAWPTLAATDGSRWVYGPEAEALLHEPGWTGVRGLKRWLASASVGGQQVLPVGDRPTLLGLMVGYLSALHHSLVNTSNLPVPDDGVYEVLVAVPAAASSAQRFLTLEAFRLAGFTVVGLLNEPAAAGIEYADRHARTLTGNRQAVLVYDLGGGTFDASVVRLGQERHEVLAHAGVNTLGGEDFDRVLADLALDALGFAWAQLGADREVRLLEHARLLKEALNANSRTLVVEPEAFGIDAEPVRIAVSDYYEALRPLVEQTLDVVQALVDDEALWADTGMAGVYVVGGASALPAVARQLRERFGRRVHRSAYPSASIALGLGRALVSGVQVLDRLARHVGVFREWDGGKTVRFDPILDPARLEAGATVTRRYRPVHTVGHLRVAECDKLDADGHPMGDLVPTGLLLVPFSRALREVDADALTVEPLQEERPLVEETWSVDGAGRIQIRVTDLEDGWTRTWNLGA